MKTLNLVKPVLFIITLMCGFSIQAASFPIPVPINHIGGGHTTKELLGVFIAFNIPSILIVMIRSLTWVITKPKWTYFKYVWYSDFELETPDVNTKWLIIWNGFVCVVILSKWIPTIL